MNHFLRFPTVERCVWDREILLWTPTWSIIHLSWLDTSLPPFFNYLRSGIAREGTFSSQFTGLWVANTFPPFLEAGSSVSPRGLLSPAEVPI